MRVVLKGIHRVKRKLANGEMKVHFYAWRGGPAIEANPGSPEFVREYHDAHASLRQPRAGTFMTIIAQYKAAPEFTGLAASTRRAYLAYIKLIEDEFGDLPVAALTDRRVRGEFKTWRDSFAETPRKADYAWTTLARVMSFAKDRGIIVTNPCERGGRLYVADRKDKIWTERDIAAVLAVASSEIQLALILALWSGQRQGDLLRLPWSAYESPYIRLRQSKGGRRVAMPAGAPLRTLLDATSRRGPVILTNTLGRPWTSDGFRTSWGKACERAGIDGLTFHDLRGTAVVRLAIAGASVPQIAAVTGHSLKDVEAILDAHYLGRDIQLAEAAVLKLEARTKL
ncbi:tyrosine-type recombinase/integrase [Bradyrhizobium japonicum]|uniref:tyrosine-type recombinase/integrase n=1 Tax=Bradyrhizobium japonicum TaxID=375 RepID=UPI0020A12C8A|nr:site-specific integrase [Bradyrhizobium japonicum]MCP1768646.1 integrase [Bradyrhizobium japonicum]MCP1794316.1 integrase [Bradyrhizobium japonicum]MCP1810928.1 integrase [Bradyrhizobium japonicum]MCP1821219.1 integrase [Bradyrhizobium japonicum]MCP1876255.1 integrase [Bradyrhizobium japonicum]